jgi:phosphate transport system protein
MREYYHKELDEIVNQLVVMSDGAQTAVRDASRALFDADRELAEQVISADERIDSMHDDLERRCFMLLAEQAPVAGELRTIVAAMHVLAEVGRIGDLAVHVAETARMRYPAHAVPEPLEPSFREMARLAEEMVAKAGRTLATRNLDEAQMLPTDDEQVDQLRRGHFQVLDETWPHGVRSAIDVTLLGRFYERIADHAVAMARQSIYIITGKAPVGENWPTT